MSLLNIEEWDPDQVSDWIKGLDPSLKDYASNFLFHKINGKRLLNFMCGELEKFGVEKIGDQLLLYDGIQRLRNELESDRVTLQSLALSLAVRCKNYRSELSNRQLNTIPTESLSSSSYLLDSGIQLLKWLTSYPFLKTSLFDAISKALTKHCFELAMLSQRDTFADNAIEEVLYLCTSIISICEKVISLNDSLIIQPAAIDVITIRRKNEQDLGIQFETTPYNLHYISSISLNSPALQLEKGDEILQVNYQTVVGWTTLAFNNLLYENSEVILTVKRRPRRASKSFCMYLRPNKVPMRKNVSVSPIKELELQKIEESKSIAETRFWKLYPKTGSLIKRRASVTGSSPTESRPPVTFFEDENANKRANAGHNTKRTKPPLDKAKSIQIELSDEILKVFVGDRNTKGMRVTLPTLPPFMIDSPPSSYQQSIEEKVVSSNLNSNISSSKVPPSPRLPPPQIVIQNYPCSSSEDRIEQEKIAESILRSSENIKCNANANNTETAVALKEEKDTHELYAGYLHKREMIKFGRWTRFFVTVDKLFFNIRIKPSEIIKMELEKMKNISFANEVHSRPHAFKFDYDNVTHYFHAESKQDYDIWMKVLTNDKSYCQNFLEESKLAEKSRRSSLPYTAFRAGKRIFGNTGKSLSLGSLRKLNEGKKPSLTPSPNPKSNISSITITTLKRFNSGQISTVCSSNTNSNDISKKSFMRQKKIENIPDFHGKKETRYPLSSHLNHSKKQDLSKNCESCGRKYVETKNTCTQTDSVIILLDNCESVV